MAYTIVLDENHERDINKKPVNETEKAYLEKEKYMVESLKGISREYESLQEIIESIENIKWVNGFKDSLQLPYLTEAVKEKLLIEILEWPIAERNNFKIIGKIVKK